MGKSFDLKNSMVLVSVEAPGGLYNPGQLKKIAALIDDSMAVAKATEDQRLSLFVKKEELDGIAASLEESGLTLRHFRDGLHQAVSCIGELCPDHELDALGSAISITDALSDIKLETSLKIGINGCAACCVPCHTYDISLIADGAGYTMYLGGKNSLIPELASFVAERIPFDKVVGLTRAVVAKYAELVDSSQDESLKDVIDRCGAGVFVELLAPYSQDAADDDDPFGDSNSPQEEASPHDGDELEEVEGIEEFSEADDIENIDELETSNLSDEERFEELEDSEELSEESSSSDEGFEEVEDEDTQFEIELDEDNPHAMEEVSVAKGGVHDSLDSEVPIQDASSDFSLEEVAIDLDGDDALDAQDSSEDTSPEPLDDDDPLANDPDLVDEENANPITEDEGAFEEQLNQDIEQETKDRALDEEEDGLDHARDAAIESIGLQDEDESFEELDAEGFDETEDFETLETTDDSADDELEAIEELDEIEEIDDVEPSEDFDDAADIESLGELEVGEDDFDESEVASDASNDQLDEVSLDVGEEFQEESLHAPTKPQPLKNPPQQNALAPKAKPAQSKNSGGSMTFSGFSVGDGNKIQLHFASGAYVNLPQELLRSQKSLSIAGNSIEFASAGAGTVITVGGLEIFVPDDLKEAS